MKRNRDLKAELAEAQLAAQQWEQRWIEAANALAHANTKIELLRRQLSCPAAAELEESFIRAQGEIAQLKRDKQDLCSRLSVLLDRLEENAARELQE